MLDGNVLVRPAIPDPAHHAHLAFLSGRQEEDFGAFTPVADIIRAGTEDVGSFPVGIILQHGLPDFLFWSIDDDRKAQLLHVGSSLFSGRAIDPPSFFPARFFRLAGQVLLRPEFDDSADQGQRQRLVDRESDRAFGRFI